MGSGLHAVKHTDPGLGAAVVRLSCCCGSSQVESGGETPTCKVPSEATLYHRSLECVLSEIQAEKCAFKRKLKPPHGITNLHGGWSTLKDCLIELTL